MSNPPTESEPDMALLNTPREAVRVLRALNYPHDEIVDALIKQFDLPRGEAELLASA